MRGFDSRHRPYLRWGAGQRAIALGGAENTHSQDPYGDSKKERPLDAMDIDAQQQIQRQLMGSERLLWAGRPRQGLLLRREDVLLIPVGILWCGFAIIFLSNMSSSGAPWFAKRT